MQTQLCVSCNEEKELRFFHDSWSSGKKKRTCRTCYGKRDRAKLKYDLLAAFDFKCQCCGENQPKFLSLDHVNNDGAARRKKSTYNEQQEYRLARRQGWPKEKYTLLCMNCNFAKGHYTVCPHTIGQTAEQELVRLKEVMQGTGRTAVNNRGTVAFAELSEQEKKASVMRSFLSMSKEKQIAFIQLFTANKS